MALTNRDTTPNAQVAEAPQQRKGSSSNRDRLVKEGNAIISAMSEEQRQALGSKSHTLHFQYLVGLVSKKAARVIKGKETVETFTPVGVCLVSDIDIEVPVIDVLKNKNTEILPEDIGSRKVKAGEQFILTYYEFMYLIIRDEYAGFCSRGDDPKGVYFSPKMAAYWGGRAKMPTPTINFSKEGSPKEGMVAIDMKNPEGKWVIKPEYEEKFGPLLRRATPTRAKGAQKDQAPTPTVVSVALQRMLNLR